MDSQQPSVTSASSPLNLLHVDGVSAADQMAALLGPEQVAVLMMIMWKWRGSWAEHMMGSRGLRLTQSTHTPRCYDWYPPPPPPSYSFLGASGNSQGLTGVKTWEFGMFSLLQIVWHSLFVHWLECRPTNNNIHVLLGALNSGHKFIETINWMTRRVADKTIFLNYLARLKQWHSRYSSKWKNCKLLWEIISCILEITGKSYKFTFLC